MRHEPFPEVQRDAIAAAAGACAADRDQDGRFPESAFTALRRLGLIAQPPLGGAESAVLLRILAAVGRGDLSVGRIFEGHVNALFLIQRFGTSAQREHYERLATQGSLFGVWNTDASGNAVTLEGRHLQGKKNFASGVDGLCHAVVTASAAKGRTMIVVPIKDLPVDRSWWRPLGMRASGSHIVDLGGMTIEAEWILGGENDYLQEPWFSAGAIRFVAVHVGGMHAVFDTAVSHLHRVGRIRDPYQVQRVGRMATAVESGYAWLDRAGKFWTQAAQATGTSGAHARLIAIANAARVAVESSALEVLEDAERSVGASGMISPHPLERNVRDLRTYLRQPNPDGALASLGSAIAGGTWSPGRSFNEIN